jgi:hypothetical protein
VYLASHMLVADKLLRINLGGIVVGFKSAAPELELFAIDSHKEFISHDPAEITITVYNQPPNDLNLGVPSFGTAPWAYYETDQDAIFQMSTYSRGIFPRTDTLIIAPGSNQADLYVEQDLAAAYPVVPGLEFPQFSQGEMMATCFLSQRKGLQFHASGINAWGGRGFLFAGYSGTGKSTIAQIWRDSGSAKLLSDERVAVRLQGGQYWLYGTPCHSSVEDSSSPEKVPLERIFILRHADHNQSRRLKPAAAVAELAARSFLPFWDSKGMDLALEFLDELVQAIPCYELGFVPDASVIDFVTCLND